MLSERSSAERKVGYGRDALVQEMVTGRTTVKALALEDSIRPIWEDRHADTIEQALDRGGSADKYVNFGAGLTMLSQVSLTAVGALAIINQDMTIGSLIAANMLVGRVLGPFNQLVGSWRNYAQFQQAVNRLGEVFRMPEERQEMAIDMGRPKGELTVDHASFSYEDEGAPVVDNLRLSIKPGSMVAIMGANGSGKTTLVKLLQGLYQPTDGRVLMDGADLTQFTRRNLASWIGYVPQEVFLFTGSIRDNIAKGHPDASDDEIIEAARRAGLHEHVIELPDGYGTDIGEAGRRLPGGLRQRLAIARAFVGEPPVIILDEPSSNLDRDGEQALAKGLRALAAEGRTVIVVSHSAAMLTASDQILVLQKGRLVRAGRPEDVLPQLLATPVRAAKPAAAPGAARKGIVAAATGQDVATGASDEDVVAAVAA